MRFSSCDGFDINGTSIRRNVYMGFVLESCQNFVLNMNTFVNDDVIIWNTGSYWDTHQISTSNTVNGRAIRNYVHTSNIVVPADTGEVLLYDTRNVKMKDLNLSDADVGIFSYDSRDLLVDGCDLSGNDYAGAYIENSADLRMLNSNMDGCYEYGLYYNGNGAVIDNNTACGTEDYGFEVYWEDIIFTNNTANNNHYGVYVQADHSKASISMETT
jgi:parallel beta-helix repeat protein